MEYSVVFGIDCGVSPGFGVKYPFFERRNEVLAAEGFEAAYREAMRMAEAFAHSYLTNPETRSTTVQLLRISGLEGDFVFDPFKAVVRISRP